MFDTVNIVVRCTNNNALDKQMPIDQIIYALAVYLNIIIGVITERNRFRFGNIKLVGNR